MTTKKRHTPPANMLAIAKRVIGLKLKAKNGEITIIYRGQHLAPTDDMITCVKQRAWRWKLEITGSYGDMDIITGKIYLNDLQEGVKKWESELSPDGSGIEWVATVVGV